MSVLGKNRFKIIFGIVLLIGAIILTMINIISNKGIEIVEWNNFYNENNVVFFYDKFPNEKLDLLN